MGKNYEVSRHDMVPEHEVIPGEKVEELLETYEIDVRQLPKILVNDPVAKEMETEPGDVLRVVRKSPTAGVAVSYRLVIER
ncbi:MAG: DNA-directed RNA polymerase subunit H [Methanonatronarchaeales archaeon]|nr:DNA-directed RNA polymerase subunit H [Methanonatronarchaeales archaeon]